MATAREINSGLALPTLPSDWQSGSAENSHFKAVGTVSPAVAREVQPYGPHFLAFARRKRHGRTFSEDERIQAQEKVKKIEDEDDMDISEDEDPAMLQRDAKDWKGQDHYAVLGLSKYRYKATPEQIKKAHRKKVLRHHPDKKAAAGKVNEDDSFFKCIQKATEILTDPVKRRQWDSVDEEANVDPPTKKQLQKGDWFKLWRKVFDAEGRFSKVQPVPSIGNADSSREEVEEFYDFFYNFDSWRTFEYLDEDVPDDNENRDHKRHIEKKNANARRKRKTEDTARLRKVVDDALASDERIKKFQKAKSANKNKKRIEKEAEAKRLAEEAAKKKEEEEKAAKESEAAAKAKAADDKKAKESAKNAVKKNRRVLKSSVKDVNYFSETPNASAAQVDNVLNDVEFIQGKLDPSELADLVSKLNIAGKDQSKVKGVWEDEAKRLAGAGKIAGGDLKALST
ncbi:putative ribosome associated chaperone [Phaeomoniella chlamydospora]|uniref:Putative ribosome associated chaperone n=1 Tax=Phaeomoniella chlamydospora TaxID=158046 RepID=A0A0G2EUA2_PHACM|nr:putative ribosome associated chaperone [Phaeomoniella chlamydospora]